MSPQYKSGPSMFWAAARAGKIANKAIIEENRMVLEHNDWFLTDFVN